MFRSKVGNCLGSMAPQWKQIVLNGQISIKSTAISKEWYMIWKIICNFTQLWGPEPTQDLFWGCKNLFWELPPHAAGSSLLLKACTKCWSRNREITWNTMTRDLYLLKLTSQQYVTTMSEMDITTPIDADNHMQPTWSALSDVTKIWKKRLTYRIMRLFSV